MAIRRGIARPGGGKVRVATWGEDPDFPGRSGIIRFSPLSDFRALQDKYRYTYEVKDEMEIRPSP